MTGARAGRSLRGFPPVIDSGVRTLVLGSFPSVRSLAKGQYYGHPQNQFWRLVGRVIRELLHEMRYEDRLETLLACRIGLWDVIGRCEREGSLDSAIRNETQNRFARVTRIAPGLCRVCFNGQAAGSFAGLFASQGYETIVMPSSSPAYTLPFEKKLRAWRKALARARAERRGGSSHESRVTSHGIQC